GYIYGRLKLASCPALTHVLPPISTCRFAHLCRTSPAAPFARRYPRDFTFYLGNLFLRLFVCHNIVKNRLSYGQRPIRPRARVAQSLCHRHRASHHPRDARSRRVVCRSSHSLHCISAAPAALDRYLAALPAMSLIPFAPFCPSISGFVIRHFDSRLSSKLRCRSCPFPSSLS